MLKVDGRDHPWTEGMTVADLMRAVDRDGRCAVVRLNGRTISRPNFEKTVIPDDAEVRLLPMIAGG